MFVAGALPIIGAIFVFNLDETLSWAGALIIPGVLVVPSALLLKAETISMYHYVTTAVHSSMYWRWYCDRRMVTSGLVFGLCLSIVVVPAIIFS